MYPCGSQTGPQSAKLVKTGVHTHREEKTNGFDSSRSHPARCRIRGTENAKPFLSPKVEEGKTDFFLQKMLNRFFLLRPKSPFPLSSTLLGPARSVSFSSFPHSLLPIPLRATWPSSASTTWPLSSLRQPRTGLPPPTLIRCTVGCRDSGPLAGAPPHALPRPIPTPNNCPATPQHNTSDGRYVVEAIKRQI